MEGLLNFVGIIIIVFGILQIVLFFKMWGMTNDIREIKNKYITDKSEQNQCLNDTVKGDCNFKVGDVVIYSKTGDKYKINGIEDNLYKCTSVFGNTKYLLDKNSIRPVNS